MIAIALDLYDRARRLPAIGDEDGDSVMTEVS